MFLDRLLRPIIKADFAVIDSQFPQKEPLGFRNTEITRYLRDLKNAHAFTMRPTSPGPEAWFRHCYGQTPEAFASNLRGYLQRYPENKNRISLLRPNIRYRIGLAYSFFLAETYTLLPFYENHNVPFVFVLYPGGGFGIGNPHSDAMLKKIFASPHFRGVIVTQRITQKYLKQRNLCPKQKVHYIYGGFVQFTDEEVPPKVSYPAQKKTFDIAFFGAKYSDNGVDKGYDLFIEAARLLATHPNIRFHVIGGLGAEDIDVRDLGTKITFYGYQGPDFLRQFYASTDILLSPNRPGKLFEGNFDGFPIGIDASYCGAALFVSDPLSMNAYYSNEVDIVLIPLEAKQIAKLIESYYNKPEKLAKLAKRGQATTQKLFNTDLQIAARLSVFKQFLTLKND